MQVNPCLFNWLLGMIVFTEASNEFISVFSKIVKAEFCNFSFFGSIKVDDEE